jgi:hypothetical protein
MPDAEIADDQYHPWSSEAYEKQRDTDEQKNRNSGGCVESFPVFDAQSGSDDSEGYHRQAKRGADHADEKRKSRLAQNANTMWISI